MKVDNITLMMFVLNFVEFCFILELIYTSDFHEGRQYFMLMLVLNLLCFILELIYSSDFHEGRQYFMLMLVLNFAF